MQIINGFMDKILLIFRYLLVIIILKCSFISSRVFSENYNANDTLTSTSLDNDFKKNTTTDTRFIKSPYTLGLFGGLNNIISDAEIPVIPGAFDCGYYKTSNMKSFYFGANFGFDIFNNWVIPELRVFYEKRPLKFGHVSEDFNVYNDKTGQYEPLIREQTYEGSLDYLLFDFGVKVNPLGFVSTLEFIPNSIGDIPVFIRVGWEAGNPIFNSDFSNYDEVVSPSHVLFPDQKKVNFIQQGSLDKAGTNYGLNFSLTGDLEIAENTFVSPEVTFRYGLNSPVSGITWKSDVFRFGIGIQHLFNTEIPEPEEEEQFIPEPEPEELEKNIIPEITNTENIVKFSGNYINTMETIVTQTYPILPYIFFNINSAEVRNVYHQNKDAFDRDNLPKSTLGIYYQMLDLVGYRLKNNPDAKITLKGYSDGTEFDSLAQRMEIAQKRAENISDYFVDQWDIDQDRITLIYDDIPALFTSVVYEEGFQENRRVEIITENPEILKPVQHSKFLEYSTNKDALNYNVETNWEKDGEMKLELLDENEVLAKKVFSGKMNGDRVISFDNDLISELANKNLGNKLLTARLTLSKVGQEDEVKEVKIPYKKSQNQFEVGRLNLIVFDFDRSDINKENATMIKKFIQTSIHPNSKSEIRGSTDRLGEMKYNKNLSLQRAQSVETFIKRLKPGYTFDKVVGLGSSNLPFDNDLPEGRFYCRTVLVEVKTPIEIENKDENKE